MTAAVAALFRHPVKSVGREPLDAVDLRAGEPVPLDRVWAVAHGRTRFDFEARRWVGPNNFLRVTRSPRLAQIRAAWAEGRLRLTHPDQEPLDVDPDLEGERIAEWAGRLADPEAQPGPYALARADRALTDVESPWVSVASLATLRALSDRVGATLDPERFRANIWLDGLDPWEERVWAGRTLQLGGARLRVARIIGRCKATEASPETGRRDAPVMDALRELCGAAEFALYAEVIEGGRVAPGDAARLS